MSFSNDERVTEVEIRIEYVFLGAAIATGLLYLLPDSILAGTAIITAVYSFRIFLHSAWFKTAPDLGIFSIVLLWVFASTGINMAVQGTITLQLILQSIGLSMSIMYLVDTNQYLSKVVDNYLSPDEDEINIYQGYLPDSILRGSNAYIVYRLFSTSVVRYLSGYLSDDIYVFIACPFDTDDIVFQFDSRKQLLSEFTGLETPEFDCLCELCNSSDNCGIHDNHKTLISSLIPICDECHNEILDECVDAEVVEDEEVLVHII